MSNFVSGKVTRTNTDRQRNRTQSTVQRPKLLKLADQPAEHGTEAHKTKSQKEHREWSRRQSRKAVEAKLTQVSPDSPQIGAVRRSSQRAADEQDSPRRPPEEPAITLPVEQIALADLVGREDTSEAAFNSLALLLHLTDDEKTTLRNSAEAMRCLAKLMPGRFTLRDEQYLHKELPVRLIRELANCGLERAAAKLIECCPPGRVVLFATRLLLDSAQPASVQDAIGKCAERADRKLKSLAGKGLIDLEADPAAIHFYDAVNRTQPVPPPPIFASQVQLEAGPEHPIDWAGLAAEAGALSGNDNDPIRQAHNKFKLLEDAFQKAGGNVAQADKKLAAEMLQKLCMDVALNSPESLRTMEDFAIQHGLRLVPAPSSEAFWTNAFKRNEDALFCAQQATTALVRGAFAPDAIARIIVSHPAAREPWLAKFRSMAIGIVEREGKRTQQYRIAEYWRAVIPNPHAIPAVTFDWPGLEAGNIDPGMTRTGLDAESFIHLQLQSPNATPQIQAKLYIAAVTHNVHESPLLQFPQHATRQALLFVVQQLSAETTARLLATAGTIARQLDLPTAMRTIVLHAPADLTGKLLRLIAPGREYDVLCALVHAHAAVEEEPAALHEWSKQFGKAHPATSEFVAQLVSQFDKDSHAPKGLGAVIAAFIEGRLGEVASEARDTDSSAVAGAYWRDYAAILDAAKPLLPPADYKRLKKDVPKGS